MYEHSKELQDHHLEVQHVTYEDVLGEKVSSTMFKDIPSVYGVRYKALRRKITQTNVLKPCMHFLNDNGFLHFRQIVKR